MSDADLTDALVTLELSDDVELKLHRLTDRDISELDLWIRGRVVAISRSAITPDMSPAEQAAIIDAGLSKAMRTSWLSGDGRALIASPDGLARILYQADEIGWQYEVIRAFLFDKNILELVAAAIREIQPKMPVSAATGKPQAGRKHPPKPKRKRNAKKK